MKRIVILTLILLLPSALSEMDHSPNDVSKGDKVTTWIDTENDIKEVSFYVCTLEEPYTCYKPETVERNNTTNGRFQFTYLVKENDYPGYKYELKKDGNETDKIMITLDSGVSDETRTVLSGELKSQVAKKIKEKKIELKNLYSHPRETITLQKAQKWVAVQVVKVFLGMPVIPGK